MKATHCSVPSPHLLKPTGRLILILLLETMAFAQVDRAVLEGTITDQTGATIAGATVRIVATDTGLSEQQTTN